MAEEEIIIDEEGGPDGTEQLPVKENAAVQRGNRRLREKNRIRTSHPLGQPVRRENPNKQRNESRRNTPESSADNAGKKPQETKKGNWAEALKKAMDAMN